MWSELSKGRQKSFKCSYLCASDLVLAVLPRVCFVCCFLLATSHAYAESLSANDKEYSTCEKIELDSIIKNLMEGESTQYGPAANDSVIRDHYENIYQLLVLKYGDYIRTTTTTCKVEYEYTYYSAFIYKKLKSEMYYRVVIIPSKTIDKICIYRKIISGISVPVGESVPTEQCYKWGM